MVQLGNTIYVRCALNSNLHQACCQFGKKSNWLVVLPILAVRLILDFAVCSISCLGFLCSCFHLLLLLSTHLCLYSICGLGAKPHKSLCYQISCTSLFVLLYLITINLRDIETSSFYPIIYRKLLFSFLIEKINSCDISN